MTPDRPDDRPEPIFNAPWPALLAAVSILGPHLILSGASDATIYQLALVPARVLAGDPIGLVTCLFVHGGWLHALMNSVFALAFGAPVARFLGLGARGGALFVLFYIVSGVFAGLGYAAIHPASVTPLVGASGAVAGLMGAAARLMDRPGRLSSPFAPRAASMALGWLIVNVVMALVGGFPGFGTGAIAWEAHLFGFAAGALLISPVSRLAQRAETH
ncbi:rhomboid family intramembrane serine protease [Caulobacter sp.]|uniref:rhomboid family intramembrane serine protease n=1 Tax=Caulobacter sp. TaxID=78 RepID=UPI003BAA74C9